MNFTALHDERLRQFQQAGLYLVTSQALSRGRRTPEIIAEALAGGVRLVQLREKEMPRNDFFGLAEQVRAQTKAADALLIINDHLDVALAVGADGVHLGTNDFPIGPARRLAPDLIIGASTHSAAEALSAERAGASYINIGPLFPTQTKTWEGEFLGLEGLKKIAALVSIPWTVMGGIKSEHVPALIKVGARTIAVVTAITAADDPEQAARELLALLKARPGASPQANVHKNGRVAKEGFVA
ncbi:MAG: thiamine phosphate synthase [Lentisphaerae bacterium]|nr:thiamine phosphate synthase [Lentisphaerota bacterium]